MKKLSVFLVVVVLITFYSCKKSNIERKIIGIWEVESFIVNGIDSTSYVKYPEIKGYRFIYERESDKNNDNTFHDIYEVNSDMTESFFGHWGERSGNKMFLGVEYKYEKTGPFRISHYYKHFDIESISRKEMKYSLQDNDLKYEITFKKI